MENKPFQVGVTGGIGAGKSIVCKIFSILNVEIFNADYRARWLMENDRTLIQQIMKAFGPSSFNGKKLNRDFLAAEVFNDEKKLDRLNQLVHPHVAEDYSKWLSGQTENPYVIKEAALLFESGSYKHLHCVINVYSDRSLRVKRILERDPFRTRSEIDAIIKRQISDWQRKKLADYEIINDESCSLIDQVRNLHGKFRELAMK